MSNASNSSSLEQIILNDTNKFLCLMIGLSVICYGVTILKDYSIFSTKVLDFFYIHIEASVFTWIHTILLFLASLLSWLTFRSRAKVPNEKILHYGWIFLTFLFLFISADEAGMIHERIGDLYNSLTTSKKLNLPPGFFLKAYAPFIVATTIFLSVFFLKLLKQNRRSGVLAFTGLSFWVGSLVVEKIDGIYRQSSSFTEDIRHIIRYTTEGFEVTGTIILVLFIVHHLKTTANNT